MRPRSSRSRRSTFRPPNSACWSATVSGLAAEIARIEPGEIIVSDALYGDSEIAPYFRELPVTPLTRDVFDGATAERRLAAYFAVATTEAFGVFSRLELTAAAACITYVERTQLGARPPLSPPTREAAGATLTIDAATRANLELMRTLSGERRGALIAAIDRTVTPAGARLLGARLAAPLTDPDAIARRLDAVALFVADGAARADVRAQLSAAPDLARALARLVLQRGGPRDLAAIRDGLAAAGELARRLANDRRHSGRTCSGRAGAGRRSGWTIAAALVRRARRRSAASEARRRLRARRIRRRARRDARAARRIPPRGRGVAGALRRRDRRARAEGAPQQRARLFRRGDGAARREAAGAAAQRDLHPSPDAGRARCASPPRSSPRSRRRSRAPPTARSAWSSGFSTGSPRR